MFKTKHYKSSNSTRRKKNKNRATNHILTSFSVGWTITIGQDKQTVLPKGHIYESSLGTAGVSGGVKKLSPMCKALCS